MESGDAVTPVNIQTCISTVESGDTVTLVNVSLLWRVEKIKIVLTVVYVMSYIIMKSMSKMSAPTKIKKKRHFLKTIVSYMYL